MYATEPKETLPMPEAFSSFVIDEKKKIRKIKARYLHKFQDMGYKDTGFPCGSK